MLDIDAYKDFARKCEITKIGFKEKLVHAKNNGMKVVGYGAP